VGFLMGFYGLLSFGTTFQGSRDASTKTSRSKFGKFVRKEELPFGG
jgi:hypothetical protein